MKRLLLLLLLATALACGQTVVTGGGASYPGVTANGSNGLNITGTLQVGPGTPNDGVTGTTNNLLAKFAGNTLIKCGTTDTAVPCYPVVSGGGTTSNAYIAQSGTATCTFDGATTANHFVQASATVAGNCHDTGALTAPTSGWVIGKVLSTNGAGGNYLVELLSGYNAASGGSSVTYWPPMPMSYQSGAYTPTAGQAGIYAAVTPTAVTFGHIGFSVSNADATHNTDIAFYNSSGALIADLGAGTANFSLGGVKSVVLSGTVPAGKFYICVATATASVVALNSQAATTVPYSNLSFAAAATGACPASITPPADSFVYGTTTPLIVLQP